MTSAWPDSRIQDLFGIALPIIQAPMAGSDFRARPEYLEKEMPARELTLSLHEVAV